MSEEYIKSRRPSDGELKLIAYLLDKSAYQPPLDWKNRLTVSPMPDGGMGSLFLYLAPPRALARRFGREISQHRFQDEDGIEVIASLNIDQEGNLFELDIWKVDYSPLLRFPDPL